MAVICFACAANAMPGQQICRARTSSTVAVQQICNACAADLH